MELFYKVRSRLTEVLALSGFFPPHVNTSLDVHKEVSNKLLQPWSVDFMRTLSSHTANKYTFKVNTRNNRKRCEICSKLTLFSSFL